MQHPLVIQIEDAEWELLVAKAKEEGISIERLTLSLLAQALREKS